MKIINSCKEAELPEPELAESDDGFLVTLYKDRFTQPFLKKLGLNERQIKAVFYVKENGKITNVEYQSINNTRKTLATEELRQLVEKDIFEKPKKKGRGAHYTLIGR